MHFNERCSPIPEFSGFKGAWSLCVSSNGRRIKLSWGFDSIFGIMKVDAEAAWRHMWKPYYLRN